MLVSPNVIQNNNENYTVTMILNYNSLDYNITIKLNKSMYNEIRHNKN